MRLILCYTFILFQQTMAYNKKNLLRRILKIQDLVKEHARHGVSQKWVYENLIAEPYNISYSTFNNYLAYPAGLELKRLNRVESAQLPLF